MRVSSNSAFANMLVVGGCRGRASYVDRAVRDCRGLLTVALIQITATAGAGAHAHRSSCRACRTSCATPLAQIRWFAELLHLGKLRSEDERVRSAGIIDQEARRLTYLGRERPQLFSRRERHESNIGGARRSRSRDSRRPRARATRPRSQDDRRSRARRQRDRVRSIETRAAADAAQFARQRREVRAGRPDDHRRLGDRLARRARIPRRGRRPRDSGTTSGSACGSPTSDSSVPRSRRDRRQRHWAFRGSRARVSCTAAERGPKARQAAARVSSSSFALRTRGGRRFGSSSSSSSSPTSDSNVQLKAVP